MLVARMSLQRLARIQGHGIRVLDGAYSEQLAEFEAAEAIQLVLTPYLGLEEAKWIVALG